MATATSSYAVLSVFFSLCVITVFARFYTRLGLLRKFSADDYLLLAGFILLIPYTAFYSIEIRHLFRVPLARFLLSDLSNMFKFSYIMLPFYFVASGFVKSSIALRILKFCGEARILRWTIIFVLTLYLASLVIVFTVNLTQCLFPIYTWSLSIKVAHSKHCANYTVQRNVNWLFSTLTCLLDFTLAVIPWFIVRKLWATNRRTRVLLSLMLSLGSIASLATIARMFYNIKYTSYPEPQYAADYFLWTYLELCLATIACSATTLKPLIVKIARLSTTGYSGARRSETTKEEPGHTTSGTWSVYRKNFRLGAQPDRSPPVSSGVNSISQRLERPQRVVPSSSPRVLRHPLSFESQKDAESRSKNFTPSTSRITRSAKSTQFSPNSTQFTATFNSMEDDDSSSEDLGLPLSATNRARTAQFQSLEAEIDYALDDEEAQKTPGSGVRIS